MTAAPPAHKHAIPISDAGAGVRPPLAWAAVAAGFVAYVAIFLPLIPAHEKKLGGDYSEHLPNLLAGYFLVLKNGLLSVPWFNPGECGGVPFIADLNVGFYALPQFLTFLVPPVTAIRITFVVFAALGALGFYILARTRFAASPAGSAVAATLFLFNGFYAYRLAIGHLTFHPFMLAPWVAVVLLPPARGARLAWNQRLSGALLAALIAGGLFAYMFQAGMVHGIAPLALAVATILLIHGELRGHSWRRWFVFAGAVLVAFALSTSRLAAALAFLHNFPRSDYPLPGFPNFFTALRIALKSLFWLPPAHEGWFALVNGGPILDRHEWEYGVGPAAALLIGSAAVSLLADVLRGPRRIAVVRHLPAIIGIGLILLLPLLLNWYVPAWNAFLKSVPLLGSSSSLIRWFLLYIPVVALVAGLAFDRIVVVGSRALFMVVVIAATILGNALVEKNLYRDQHYSAAVIDPAWHAAHTSGTVPPIRDISLPDSGAPATAMVLGASDDLAEGHSQLFCYQPIFGYELQNFIRGNLTPGPVLDRTPAGTLNLKNPVCDLFPKENSCRPGGEFRLDQIAAAEAFTHYESFQFNRSTAQTVADWLNLVALVIFGGAFVALLILQGRHHRRRPGPGVGLDANPSPG
jgi:hypothetical protein